MIEFARHSFDFFMWKTIFFKMTLLNQFSQNFIQIYGQRALFHRFVRNRQCFCQMQSPLNQRAKLSVKFAASLFSMIVMHTKKPDEICNSSGFSI
ncbi:hypothetical protein [Ligilactobacillus ruminis]|uniref:hypothetical protein n=1 Tax=Ligilactobacillus ruminis TaxID=1623 RepID=UPI0022E8725A|nr:hypothetical protein [Ligilactobacillus ruminis]